MGFITEETRRIEIEEPDRRAIPLIQPEPVQQPVPEGEPVPA